ncbi:MAG: DUF4234 domain-containing protein [Acidimicrobiales bacterium]
MTDAMVVPGATAPAAESLGTPRSIGKCIFLAVVTLGIYTFFWTFKTHEEIKRRLGDGVGGVVGLVIYLVVSPVTYFLIPSEVGKLYQADGQQPPVKGLTGLWILLPLIGAFVWFAKVQGALNQYWKFHGAPEPA